MHASAATLLRPIVTALGIVLSVSPARAELTDGPHDFAGEAVLAQTVAAPLNRPWGLAFLPDGDLLVTEKNGGLSRLRHGSRDLVRIDGLPKDLDQRMQNAIDNTGLFDVAVDPRYERSRRIFLSYASANADGSTLRVVSFRLEAAALRDPQEILRVSPASLDRFHYGGALLFDTDGMLLITVGERFEREKRQGAAPVAQVMSDLRGKIVRVRRDGTAAEGNPRFASENADPRIYALGVRNSQGLARDPRSGRIWFSEHGPLRGDELNVLARAANYGWPQTHCGRYKDEDYRPPTRDTTRDVAPSQCWSRETYAPAGMTFYDGAAFPSWRGKLLVAGLSAGRLLLVDVRNTQVLSVTPLLISTPTRLRDVAVASDGTVYLAVDGEQGRIVRLSPQRSAGQANKTIVINQDTACHERVLLSSADRVKDLPSGERVMSTESIARRLVQLCREGKFTQAHDELYAENARSIEIDGMTGPLGSVEGLDAIREKARRFDDTYTQMHSVEVSEPLIAAPFFSLVMGFDATYKEGGRRALSEICVYEVANDKIVREQFFYSTG